MFALIFLLTHGIPENVIKAVVLSSPEIKVNFLSAKGSPLTLLEQSHLPTGNVPHVKTPKNVTQLDGALIVFTLIRHDLLALHLASVDTVTEHVFVVFNYADERIKNSTLSTLQAFAGCNQGKPVGTGSCRNGNIKHLHILGSMHNSGFSGSVNRGIKTMIEYNFDYSFFSGDDTRFRPGRLASAIQIIEKSRGVCLFNFEGYSSFVLTREGVHKVGPFDENFWPAYAEDCDHWFRAQLAKCRVYYRGGYAPERSESSLANAFLDHGDTVDSTITNSVTHRSDPGLEKLVQGTLDGRRGRFAYLLRKWGINTCDYYHEVLHAKRMNDVILDPQTDSQLQAHNARFKFPYNDSNAFPDIRHWDRVGWKQQGVVSPRAVNINAAPPDFVWQEADYMKLSTVV